MDDFSCLVGAIVSTYATDAIFILGRGLSIDVIPPQIFFGSLVIGVNDVERVYTCDISVCHARWAAASLAESGPRPQLCLTSTFCRTPHAQVLRVPHVPLTQEGSDPLVQRLMSREVVAGGVHFLTAVRVARKMAELQNRPQTESMVRFGFCHELGNAHVSSRQIGDGDGGGVGARHWQAGELLPRRPRQASRPAACRSPVSAPGAMRG